MTILMMTPNLLRRQKHSGPCPSFIRGTRHFTTAHAVKDIFIRHLALPCTYGLEPYKLLPILLCYYSPKPLLTIKKAAHNMSGL